MTDIEVRTTIEPERAPTPDRQRWWWMVAVLVLAGVAAAGAGIALLAERTEPEDNLTTVAPETADEPAVDDQEAVGQLALAIMDDSRPVDERVALVHDPEQLDPSALAVLSSFDHLAARAGVTDAEVVRTQVVGDAAVVDVDVSMDGTFGTSAHLSSFVAQRVDGTWLLTRETLCGLAQQAATVGAATTCTAEERIRRAEGEVPLVDLLLGDAGTEVDTDRAITVETGWWNTDLVGVGDDWWFLDYPGEQLGGGGPVGPANLVRVDSSGAETARIELDGTDARLVGGDERLWVLQQLLPGDGVTPDAGVTSLELLAIDAASAQVLTSAPVGPLESPVASNGEDVFVVDGASLHRYDGRTLQRLATAGLGMVASADLVTATDDEIWFGDAAGRAAVASMDDLSVRGRAVPDGQVVGSGDRVWSIRSARGSTTIERIDADEGAPPRTLHGLRLTTAWTDLDGGLWVAGDLGASPGATTGVHMPVVSRPLALQVRRDGTVAGTWWLEGSQGAGSWFVEAAGGLARSDQSGVTLLSAQP